MRNVNLDEKYISQIGEILKKNLQEYSAKPYFYGSRVKGKNAKYSDVDIAVRAEKKLPFGVLCGIKDDLTESTIPYFVDVIDLNSVSEKFKKCIENDLVEFSY